MLFIVSNNILHMLFSAQDFKKPIISHFFDFGRLFQPISKVDCRVLLVVNLPILAT